MRRSRPSDGRIRLAVAYAATAAVLGPLIWLWQDSLLPEAYSVMDMGYADYGGGPSGSMEHSGGGASAHGGHARQEGAGRDVTQLIADPDRPADIAVTVVARKQRFRLASGRAFEGYTLNGQSPGPVIKATQGQLVQVRLVNESVPGGITLHWHGLDVPGAADGVAGVTQDAVAIGKEFTYRFIADQAGTFWYHSHQMSHEQVRGGLLGALVVTPPGKSADASQTIDVEALVHLYNGVRTINGREGDVPVRVPPGARARVRVINTEYGVMPVWVSGAPYRLAAIDGTEINEPTPVQDKAVAVAAGGRADIEVTMPEDGSPVRIHLGGPSAVVLGSTSHVPPPIPRPAATLDPLTYGTRAPLAFDPGTPDRRFEYDMGRRPGFLDGVPGLWWTINGHMYPDVPMFHVAQGDVVRMRISNNSGEAHPMHLHGHHAVVLSRDGVPATGSPWWVDSLEVGVGETYEIAFVADNPGIWMDHCHNLPHASEGLTAHLMYEGVTTPFTVGGPAENEPE
ncbi:multicopper oxidase family protein [Nonomuraea africana]|uniref:FtsP/CotA-like multicopper oxidase with cupredoxin domain n=1 Tax=Nonomuraea africana TaxID=46171 RepID=A0ABR9KJ72_9ACTN|nr:multicopper oxidase family protein [Nonomuraea africana]MBE1562073.1 FtsP/CotA-like multicopper oxidase with cupredoxin domain [Nonomuraea africana]